MAGNREAKIKFTAETKDLTNQLNQAKTALSAFKAGLKLNEAQLKNTGNQTEFLKNKQTLLKQELEANAQKQAALTGKLEAAKRIYGEDSAEAQKWATQLAKAQTEEEQLKAALTDCEQAMIAQAEAEKQAATPLEQLNRKIEEQKTELEQLKTEYKNTALEQGQGSQAATDLKEKISQLSKEISDDEKKMRQLDEAVDEAGNSAEQSANGGWSILRQVMADFASNMLQQGIQALKDFGRETIQLGTDFTSSMSNVQAISGATTDELAELEEKARTLGASTIYSASEVADGFGYMAMAGWETEDMLGGIEGILNLAAASEEDLATTSDIVTDALTAFGMSADEAGHFADVMAATASSANTNVSMLGESFKYVAPVAGSLGYSVEDVNLALGLMANSGIKASSAGTSLKNLLTNMSNPTDKMAKAMDTLGVSLDDGNGNMLSFKEVMDQLRGGFGNLSMSQEEATAAFQKLDDALAAGEITEAQYNKQTEALTEQVFGAEGALKAQAAAQLAGKQGMAGLLAIVGATDEDYEKLTQSINEASDTFVKTADGSIKPMNEALENGEEIIEEYSGAAEAMAATMQDNLGGDIKELKSAIEEFQLKLFEVVEGPLRSLMDTLTVIFTFLGKHTAILGVLVGIIAAVTVALATHAAVQAIKVAMDAAEVTSLGALIVAKLAAVAASWAFIAPYLAIAAVIVAVIAVIVLIVRHWDQIKAKMIEVAQAIKDKVVTTWNNLKTSISTTVSNIKTKVSTGFQAVKTAVITPVQNAVNRAKALFNGAKSAITSVVDSIKTRVSSAFNAIKNAMTNPIQTAKNTLSNIVNRIKGIFPVSLGKILHFSLPHISVSGGSAPWGIGGKGTKPSFSVSWSSHAKGGIFKKSTLIPTMNAIHEVGEAGPEAVSPISLLQDYVGDAVRKAVPPIDYDKLADKVAAACARMNISINVNDRELGRVVRGLV